MLARSSGSKAGCSSVSGGAMALSAAARPLGRASSCRRLGRPRSLSSHSVCRASSSSSSSDPSPPTNASAGGGRRAAIACGCAACAFALLGGARRGGAATDDPSLFRPRGGAYDQYFAKAMGTMDVYERDVAELKRQLFGELARDLFDGKRRPDGPTSILELGIGRGPNAAILAEAVRDAGGDVSRGDVRLTGVDPNPAMLPYAREAALAAGWPEESVDLRPLYAEQLSTEFGGNKAPFDAAVITLVLCSVPDPQRALREVKAVVKGGGGGGDGSDGGRLLLIEHVADPRPRSLRRFGQRLLNPLQNALADGCNLDRETEVQLRAVGILPPTAPAGEGGGDGGSAASANNEGRLKRLEIDGLGLLAPHIAGVLEL